MGVIGLWVLAPELRLLPPDGVWLTGLFVLFVITACIDGVIDKVRRRRLRKTTAPERRATE